MLDRFTELEHDWERRHLGDKDLVFKNTFADIERILKTCGDQGTRFEFECYDTAHLYNLANILERGLVRRRCSSRASSGCSEASAPTSRTCCTCGARPSGSFGEDFEWSMLGAGSSQIRVGTIALALGANARVGLEDSLWDGPGRLAESSRGAGGADQVRCRGAAPRDRDARRGAPPASPASAR